MIEDMLVYVRVVTVIEGVLTWDRYIGLSLAICSSLVIGISVILCTISYICPYVFASMSFVATKKVCKQLAPFELYYLTSTLRGYCY
jgi:hypothetical protein